MHHEPNRFLYDHSSDMQEIVAAITKIQKGAKELLAHSSQRSPAHAAG
jgi:hypothetical protein